jgi:hypothetical protein
MLFSLGSLLRLPALLVSLNTLCTGFSDRTEIFNWYNKLLVVFFVNSARCLVVSLFGCSVGAVRRYYVEPQAQPYVGIWTLPDVLELLSLKMCIR